MKKHLWIFAAAAAALAACSNDDTIAVNQGFEDANAISFRTFVEGQTRAADIETPTSSAGLTAFNVTAYTTANTPSLYFDNVTFNKTSGTANFGSTNKYYWPSSTNLNFFAYAPVSNGQVVRGGYNTFTVTPSTTVSEQADLVYGVTRNWGRLSTDNGGVTGHVIPTASGVTLNFSHAESKVLVQFENSNPNLIITVGNVSIANVKNSGVFTWNGVTDGTTPTAAATASTDGQYTTGTLTYLNGTWDDVTSPATSPATYTVAMGTDSYDDDDNDGTDQVTRNVFSGKVTIKRDLTNTAANHEMILIPQALTGATAYPSADGTFSGPCVKVQLKIQNKENNAYIVGGAGADSYVTAIWPLTAITWLPGHKYTYSVDLAGGGYHETDIDSNTDLDPILEGAEIKFVTVTVDNWADGEATSVYKTGL